MGNLFSDSEMGKLRLEYMRGKTLDCPRCHEIMDAWEENGPLFLNQVPGGPEFQYLVVECTNGHAGRIILGR